MNIRDIEEVKVAGDMLVAMVAKQKALEEKYHEIECKNLGIDLPKIPVDINSPRGQYYIKDLMWRTVEELGEAANCLKNKPWKSTNVLTDEDHFYEELADAIHFFLQLLIATGLSAEDICALYFKKSKVNEFRQRSNY